MNMNTLRLRLTGTTALLMHSARGANPLDPMTKEHKKLTSKRKKTDDDYEAIAKSEWNLGLYHDEEIGPYVSGAMIRAALVNGAKFNKLGATVKRSTIPMTEKAVLNYKGPRDRETLFECGNYIQCDPVGVGTARLMRTRPVFSEWTLEFELMFDEQSIEKQQILDAMTIAGLFIGIGDWRPQCGGQYCRFEVEEVT